MGGQECGQAQAECHHSGVLCSCAQSLVQLSILQETDEAAVLEDIEEGAMAGRDKFSKLLETHAELTAQLFFLKQLQV